MGLSLQTGRHMQDVEFIVNPSLLAGSSTTTRSKKPLLRALHCRWHHSAMKGYKNWCNAMTCASTVVETMSKSSVRYVNQMAIYMVCNIFWLFLDRPAEHYLDNLRN